MKMGGQVHGPNLGSVPRLGYRRTDEPNQDPGVEPNGSEEGLIIEEKQSKEGRCSTPTGTRRSTAVPAWSAGRRSARRNNKTVAISQEEWRRLNDEKCKRADISRHKSFKSRAEAIKLRSKEEAETVCIQEKAEHRLKERLEETIFWSEEVENEVIAWEEEKLKLSEIRSNLEHAHSQTCRPARLADKCIRNRENRIGADQVLDEVEQKLILEIENIRLWQIRIKIALDQVEFQETSNQALVRSLYRDLNVKTRAADIDSSCSRLNNKSNKLTLHTGADVVSIPASWQTQTQSKIAESRKRREWSQQLRSDIETLVRSACTDLINHWKKTNSAFKDNIENLKHSIQKIVERLDAIVLEIQEQGREIDQLKSALSSKGAPLKLAQTRLNMRTQRTIRGRSGWEGVDDPQSTLVGEVTKILDNIQLLNNQLRKAESSLKELTSQKIKLEYDLHVKQTSLGIDQEKCIQTRTKYPIKLKGSWQKILENIEKEKKEGIDQEKRRRKNSDSSEEKLDSMENNVK
ncbi:tektin-3 [Eurytemora carolleeae]|uniref:tektin-3 n=1 Tax=Eurytemora carolleeae TaxID=1294199 RepID=UPI000C76B708|nr:tektin-3 [Eurytemora carolleeae]XP_023335757.1 tektin-3 [Eurytemora carolleeae]|eukprot:XP_023335756.1 tektin-3-like [Eurytemora affinis]